MKKVRYFLFFLSVFYGKKCCKFTGLQEMLIFFTSLNLSQKLKQFFSYRKVALIIEELIATEKEYVKSLNYVIEVLLIVVCMTIFYAVAISRAI